MLKELKILTLLFFTICISSCSNDSGPGYQEPYIPEPTSDDGPVEEEPLTDDELLDLVQEETFNYFWDFAEPESGMARERSQEEAYNNESRNIVTMGGSGFGIASFPAAVQRGWISRDEALTRLDRILNFLESVPTYHGAFSHWYMGNTAQTRPFGSIDDGGDLVETAFLIEGLLINRQFLMVPMTRKPKYGIELPVFGKMWNGIGILRAKMCCTGTGLPITTFS